MKRQNTIKVRLSDSEWEAVLKAASDVGLPPATWARTWMMIGSTPPQGFPFPRVRQAPETKDAATNH